MVWAADDLDSTPNRFAGLSVVGSTMTLTTAHLCRNRPRWRTPLRSHPVTWSPCRSEEDRQEQR
jgi:hypothetical protein